MRIRKARWADVQHALAIERAVFGRESYSSATFIAHLLRDWKGFFVSETEEGEITGYVLVRTTFGLLAGRRGGITSVAVAKERQRRGIGRELVLHALEHLRGRRAVAVDLEVAVSNRPAQSLYQSLGFQRDRTLPHYYGRDKHGVRMVRDLRRGVGEDDLPAASGEGRLAEKAGRGRNG